MIRNSIVEIKTRTVKGGAFADKAHLRGLKAKTDFYQLDLVGTDQFWA
jgi:hypothetical protein